MGSRQDQSPPEPPPFDGVEAETMPAAEKDLGRIDTDRHKVPPAAMSIPSLSDDIRRELDDGGFSRIDTLPEGFASVLQRRTLEPGDTVGGRYKLLEVLGGGAMGHVFVAENKAIGVRVAVKVLKPELLANPEFRQRFQYEAQAVGTIEHPNVARFIDVVVGDPTFLVMEYVPGETLATVLTRDKTMSQQRAAHIATRLAWGLDAAHAAGIIHRDLKPANVILTADREVGETPKLVDFGLAKISAVAGAEQLTRTGQIIGTPAYMSPEQISGRDIDPRSDVYALACLFYEMLAGRPPFTGSDDVQTLYRQLHEPAEPLSLHAPNVSPALDRVINRALAKNPHDRYGSMQELARALNGAVEKRRGSDVAPRTRGRRSPLGLTLAFVGGVALTAGAGAWRAAQPHKVLAAPAAPAGVTIFVASDPPGASVTVDGNPVAEKTPTALPGLSPGTHAVRASMPGHAPVEQHATLAAGERTLVQLALPAVSHAVRLETVPSGAIVYVDGVLQIGQTPMELHLADNEFYNLRMEKNGFELTTRSLTPDDRDPVVSVVLPPEKMERGTLMLDSDAVAEVWVDGHNAGLMSPTVFQLPAGEHQVQLRDGDEARSTTVKVKIKVGQATHLTLKGSHG